MVLKSIIIQNFGGVTRLSYEFRERLNVVKEIGRDVISYAIRAIFNHKTPPPPASWVGVDTRVEASVSLPQKSYHVTLTPDTEGGRLRLRSYDKDGIDVTQEYLYLTSHCIEQDMSDVFDGEESVLLRFLKYANEDIYFSPRELATATDGLSNLKSFRNYLRSFISGFKPELLRDGRSYEIFLKNNGIYAVRCRVDGRIIRALSEAEKTLFRYLCFLRTAEFWHGFEELRNLHCIKKPFIVSDFLEKLDQSIDVKYLLDRTEDLNRQTILLAHHNQTL